MIVLLCSQIVLLGNAAAQAAPVQTRPQDSFPGKSWQHVSSFESAGWSRNKLAVAHEYADADSMARVVDLLRARSGVYHLVDFETESMRKSRPARGSHAPGTFWYYNNWDFNVLGTIFEKKTGLKIGAAFYRRIAKPIGMQDFQPGDVFYFGGPAPSILLITLK
jgi:CubicO group peptidase (beta-lactamase class C family)